MTALRRTLSTTEEVTALYTYPAIYTIAEAFVTESLETPRGHRDFTRNMTYLLLDIETRTHGNRQKLDAHLRGNPTMWQDRARMARSTTGIEILLPSPPNAESVRKWRHTHFPVHQATPSAEVAETVEVLRRQVEETAMELANALGHFEQHDAMRPHRIAWFNSLFVDGTYLSPHSKVDALADEDGNVHYTGTRAAKHQSGDGPDRRQGPRVQDVVHRTPKDGRVTMGVNHLAPLIETDHGRIVFTVERALDGEERALLRSMKRLSPLAPLAIQAIVYDGALYGWPRDYLLAHYGILSVAPEPPAKKTTAQEQADRIAPSELAKWGLEDAGPSYAEIVQRHRAHTTNRTATTATAPSAFRTQTRTDTALTEYPTLEAAPGKKLTAAQARRKRVAGKAAASRVNPPQVKAMAAIRELGEAYGPQLIEDLENGRALGTDLAVGTCAYFNSHADVSAVTSVHQYWTTHTHTVGDSDCTHQLWVDDGAVWSVDINNPVADAAGLRPRKKSRLRCVESKLTTVGADNLFALEAIFEWECHHNGETLQFPLYRRPSGEWRDSNLEAAAKNGSAGRSTKNRMPIDNIQLLARCDPAWPALYSRRNNTESWFAWMKKRMLEDSRAASLDLDHQFLDILFAGIVTNAITHHRAMRSGDLDD